MQDVGKRAVTKSASPITSSSVLPTQFLTEAERRQVLVEWNATQMAYPKDQCIPQMFEAQVECTPQEVALVFEGEELTYHELNERANQLAHHLRKLGVEPEACVGLCVERSLEMVVGLLGILKAGGAYVPLDPAYPVERLSFMLEDSHAAVLVTQQHLVERLPIHNTQVLCMDTDAAELMRQPTDNPMSTVASDNLAYVIYTSGSTGRPKGVQILHRAVVNFLTSTRYQPGLTAQDTLLAVTTLSFDIAVFDLFLPLIVGARLIVATRDIAANGKLLVEMLNRSNATVMSATPVTWRILLAAGWQGNPHLKIISTGEALPLDLAQQLLPMGATLWNMYGPTETTIWSSGCKISPEDDVITIGRPIANTQFYVLDAQMQPVPIGITGELYIGGDGLARGYLNRSELTAAKFVSNPFSSEPEARLYKTGDLARYLPDGNIEYLGRLDHQVKIRGFRIELGEIETVLRQHPGVREAVVAVREDLSGDKRLVAYLVPRQGATPTVSDLQGHVMRTLPGYMVPFAFVWLESLPLTPNGKVDRRALPAPDLARQTMEEPFVAPMSLVHYQLKQIWEALLDVRPIGIRDNFFHLGGHSLLAARLVTQIEQVFGKRLSPATLFSGPTIEQLAYVMEAEEERSSHVPLVAVQAHGSRRPFFYLHGAWDSDAFYCFHLAHHLGPEQPFYALAPYNFASLQIIPSIEEMAAAHIQLVRTIQPEGPYLLGGFCNGGLLAYEMARQLAEEGQRVDLLVLIEPAYPPILHALARGVVNHVGNLLGLSQEKQLECFLRLRHMYKYMRGERKKVEDLKAFRNIDQSILTLTPTVDALLQDDNALFDWIIADYTYNPYPGKISLIWADEEPFHGVWQRKAAQKKDIELQFVPGTHIGCRTDHIQDLAEALGRCFSQVQTTELKESTYSESITASVD